MADGVEIEVKDRIAATIASKLREIRGEAQEADTAINRLRNNLNLPGANGLLKAASDTNRLERALHQATTVSYSMVGATSNLADRARHLADQESRARREIDRATDAMNRQRGSSSALGAALRGIVGGFSLYGLMASMRQAADTAQTVANKIRAVAQDTEGFERAQTKLYEMARENRVSIDDLATAYQRFSFAMRGVASEQEIMTFIDTLSKSLIVFGATTNETSSVITQLSQAFNKGKLDGDEFRTVMEALPSLSDALTSALGKTKDQLYALAKAGLLTPEVILKAFQGSAEGIKEAFDKTIPTIDQAMTVMRTQFAQFMSENSAASEALARAIMWVADNLTWIIPIIAAFGAAWIAVGIAAIVMDLFNLARNIVDLTIKLGAFAVANAAAVLQVGLWVAAVTAAALAGFGWAKIIAWIIGQGDAFDQWVANSIEQIYNWGQALGAQVGEVASNAVNKLTSTINQTATDLNANLIPALDKANNGLDPGLTSGANEASNALKKLEKDTAKSMRLMSASIRRVVNDIDTMVWKLRGGEAQAERLYDALKAGNYNPGNYATEFANGSTKIMTGNDSSFRNLSMTNSVPAYEGGSIVNITGNKSGSFAVDTYMPGYATGGKFIVGGRAGRDTNMVSFRATKGEEVSIRTKAQQRQAERSAQVTGYGAQVINNFNVYANDADSFRRSRTQIAADFAKLVGR